MSKLRRTLTPAAPPTVLRFIQIRRPIRGAGGAAARSARDWRRRNTSGTYDELSCSASFFAPGSLFRAARADALSTAKLPRHLRPDQRFSTACSLRAERPATGDTHGRIRSPHIATHKSGRWPQRCSYSMRSRSLTCNPPARLLHRAFLLRSLLLRC